MDAKRNIVGVCDIGAQTRQTLENVKAALQAVGGSMEDVIKTTIFLTDLANYKGMNVVYNHYFGHAPPARATVLVGLALPELLIEIEALAVVDGS